MSADRNTSGERNDAGLLQVDKMGIAYGVGQGRTLTAVDDVSFSVGSGETLALVGESGCGKSSVARGVMQLTRLTRGTVSLQGRSLTDLSARELKPLRRRLQMIFQDPISSLNGQHSVREILEMPLRVNGLFGRDSDALIRSTLELVGMDASSILARYPKEFSGGQCQRISIARALILNPSLLVCDEPVSALDVSVRSQVLNVLNELRTRLRLGVLFISHDLSVVRNVADRVAVMYLGRICEAGPAKLILESPSHPYTAALISAVPVADPSHVSSRIRLRGELPSQSDRPDGCAFRLRCPRAEAMCAEADPPLRRTDDGREVACHFPLKAAGRAEVAELAQR